MLGSTSHGENRSRPGIVTVRRTSGCGTQSSGTHSTGTHVPAGGIRRSVRRRRAATEVASRNRVRRAAELIRRSVEDDSATAGPRIRAEIKNQVGCFDELRIVLNNDEAVSSVPQSMQNANKPADIA